MNDKTTSQHKKYAATVLFKKKNILVVVYFWNIFWELIIQADKALIK